MKNYFPKDLEDSEDCLAEIKVYVDQNGEIGFNCSWEPDEVGVHSIASIFFGLAYNDLAEQILNNLKSQCVLEGNEEDFFQMVEFIRAFIIDKGTEETGKDADEDSLVVSPKDIIRF